MKKLLSILMALVLVFTMIPVQGAAAETAGSTITVSGSSYRSKYVVVSDGSSDGLYYINSQGVIETTDGTAAQFAPGSYTIYYGLFSGRGASFARASVTVSDSSTNVSASLRSAQATSASAAVRELYAISLYHNTTTFNHVDLRVAATYDINIGNQTYTAAVYNPSVVVKVGSRQVASKSWSGTTSYEWRQDGLTLTKASTITVELTLDLRYTDNKGETHMIEDIQVVYDNVNDVDKFIESIAICDMVWGLDFQVDVEEIQEVIEYHTVTYEWKVYNLDGTYTELPAGAHLPPAATSGHATGTQYSPNEEFVSGTSFYDYENGLLYTFHGWDTHSHSDVYNPVPSEGYHALEEGDTVEITDDTYIYGYWTVTELEPSSAHISIEKVFVVDGVEVSFPAAEDLWFRIDTGIDRDGDGDSEIAVDYSMLQAASGEYKIPVYQYDTPFRFTEQNADVPGYTRTTTVQVSGQYITGSSQDGDSVTVSMQPVYEGENIHLGTVTYTNSYTKKIGAPVSVYPTLTLVKSAADTRLAQAGVEFTLYADAACSNAVATVTTGSGGIVNLDFGTMANVTPDTYYLKETQPLDGYHADPLVYPITLAATKTAEELREGEFVQVTYYGLSIALPAGSTAAHESGSNRLHIFDEPILGSLRLRKTVTGMAQQDMQKLQAVVIVHGPIARDNAGSITDIGDTWQLDLNSANGFAASLEELPLGEYLIHESFASVHGYTWTKVTYGALETLEYNGITSGLFRVEDDAPIALELVNTYVQWEDADFYIKKVNEQGTALAGAVFTLSTDEAGANVIASKTTGADGYAHFSGFTVPAGQESVTYYLRETKAPQGYYLSDQVYQVVITAVTDNAGHTTYEPQISLRKGRSNGFDIDTDLLTVTNYPVLGQLTVTKAFADGFVPAGLSQVSVLVSGPNGYSRTVKLSSANSWSATLTGLPMGTYTVTEQAANVPGYTWTVSYSAGTVTLAEANPGKTAYDAEISGNTTVTNRYTRNEEIYEVPTALTVKKVGEQGEALAGAVFKLEQLGADGKVISSRSFTTGTDGTVMFDLLAGSIGSSGPIDGTYILSETKAPAGYDATSATWTVTVREDDGQIRWNLNENKNIFEGFWDWIVGNVSAGKFENGVLTVQNLRSVGNLVIEKAVVDPEGLYAGATYSFTLDCSDNAFDKTFTLKAGQSVTVKDIPFGTAYTLTENTTGAAFTGVIADGGNGKIQAEQTRIVVTNTYAYASHHAPVSLVKVDAQDATKVIPGAGFTLYSDKALKKPVGAEVFSDESGKVSVQVPAAGTYYLAETTAPAGYHASDRVYEVTAEEKVVVLEAGTANAVTEKQLHIRIAGLRGTSQNGIDYTYQIENTAIKVFSVSVQKVWVASEGVIHPASVEAVLYRDGKAYDTVTLSAENGWRHTWTDLTDEYTWTVDEASVPAGYTKEVTADGHNFTITNTKLFKVIDISAQKVWVASEGVIHPASVEAVLYRDGKVYDTAVLNAENNWRHTWNNLTDEYTWTLDETSVPEGYTKEVTAEGYDFTITNTKIFKVIDISVQKVWVASEGVIHPESVEAVLYRDGKVYDTVTLSAKNNWRHTWKDLTDEFVWTLDEVSVPEGYTKNVTAEGFDFTITNTKLFKVIDISAQKVWVASEGVIHPESVEAVLYRDGKVYDTVVLNAENNWRYTWEDLTDEFVWTLDEPSVPEGYTKEVTAEGYDFTITNTKLFSYINVHVEKVWYGAEGNHPESVDVTLYRDGKVYDTVTLSAENKWRYIWRDLTDEFEWDIDEPSVPSGYDKTVRRNGYNFVVVNTHVDAPKTGDMTDLMGMGMMLMVGVAGLGITLLALLAPRKKKEEA